MNAADQIRDELWRVIEAVREGELAAEDAEQMISALDSLAELVRISDHPRGTQGYQQAPLGATLWQLREGVDG